MNRSGVQYLRHTTVYRVIQGRKPTTEFQGQASMGEPMDNKLQEAVQKATAKVGPTTINQGRPAWHYVAGYLAGAAIGVALGYAIRKRDVITAFVKKTLTKPTITKPMAPLDPVATIPTPVPNPPMPLLPPKPPVTPTPKIIPPTPSVTPPPKEVTAYELKFSNVQLEAGGSNMIQVSPGQHVTVDADYQMLAGRNEQAYILVGFDKGGPQTGIRLDQSGFVGRGAQRTGRAGFGFRTHGNPTGAGPIREATFNLRAPTKPGVYEIRARYAESVGADRLYSAQRAIDLGWWRINGTPPKEATIAILEVI